MAQATNVPQGYDSTSRKAYNSQADCMDSWENKLWAEHNTFDMNGASRYSLPSAVREGASVAGNAFVSELYASENFRAYQFDTGAGVVMHYDTREAIRLSDGTIYQNDQCFATGFAKCTHPSDYAARLPFMALEEMMDNEDTLWDIETVIGQPTTTVSDHSGKEFTHHRARNTVVKIAGHDSDYWLLIGKDRSINDRANKFVFRHDRGAIGLDSDIESPDIKSYINELLTPEAVRNSARRVVSADEYVKTRLDETERTKHVQAGGKVSESRSWYRDEPVNRQHYRADLQGNVIVRHGEWFFIPRPHADPDESGLADASDTLDNHVAVRTDLPRSPLPQTCPDCGNVPLHIDNDGGVSCESCGETVPRQIFVRGEIRHAEGDHDAVNLGDTWHEAVSHDKEVLVYDDRPTENARGRRGRGMRFD